MSLRIGVGASSSTNTTDYHAVTAQGSTVYSGNGDVTVVAREGDLSVIGSTVEGVNTTVAALDGDLLLLSAQEGSRLKEDSKAGSAEIGVTIGSEAGIGIYVSASAAKGKGAGNGTTHVETVIGGHRGTTTFVSGGDTVGRGAQILGDTVIGRVGGDLLLESQQDSNDYKRSDVSAGIDVAFGTGGASVNANVAASKVKSTYDSVNEQTGIQAGAGGFDLQVNGHTQLDGAAIASTAEASKNRFETGTLGWSDIGNAAEYEATSVSVSGGTGGGMSASASHTSDSARGATQAGIAEGTLIVKDASGGDIARGVTSLQQDGLTPIFDQNDVAEDLEMQGVAGEVGFTAVGDFTGNLKQKAEQDLQAAKANGDKTAEAQAQQRVDAWSEGGTYKTLSHAIAGAAVAALGGGHALEGMTAAVATQQALPKMLELLEANGIAPTSTEGKAILQAASLAIGAATTGNLTGGGIAMSATNNNWLKHAEFEELKDADAACEGGNQTSCQRADALRALDSARDREYANYALATIEQMKKEGVDITEDSFSERMESYWDANGIDKRDVVYPDGGHIPQYQTPGQELYGFVGDLAEKLPDWYPGKMSAAVSAAMMQGLMEQGGQTIAGWMDVFSDNDSANYFTGDVVSGIDAWDARFGSAAEIISAVAAGGPLAKQGVNALGNVADGLKDEAAKAAFREAQGVFAPGGVPLMNYAGLSNPQKMVVAEILGEQKILNLVPDGKMIGRSQGVGETGIDNIMQVNRPDVDYVIVEYKFGTSKLGNTADGVQGSDSWITGSNRLINAASGDEQVARSIAKSVSNGRVERWVVNTDPSGGVSIGVLDKNGRFIPKPKSALFGGSP